MNSAEVQLVLGLVNALVSYLQGKSAADIPAEMQQAMAAAHAELVRIGAVSPLPPAA